MFGYKKEAIPSVKLWHEINVLQKLFLLALIMALFTLDMVECVIPFPRSLILVPSLVIIVRSRNDNTLKLYHHS